MSSDRKSTDTGIIGFEFKLKEYKLPCENQIDLLWELVSFTGSSLAGYGRKTSQVIVFRAVRDGL